MPIMIVNGIDIQWLRKPIRRMHLHVYPDGRVMVSSPWYCSSRDVENFVSEHGDWLLKTRARLLKQPPKPALKEITSEQKVLLQTYLTERVEYWRKQMGESFVQWKLRNMKTQWGNCRAQTRRLTFNLQLARVPDELRDYVIVHELAHLRVQNHSARFYQHVAEYIPDWATRRKALRAYQ